VAPSGARTTVICPSGKLRSCCVDGRGKSCQGRFAVFLYWTTDYHHGLGIKTYRRDGWGWRLRVLMLGRRQVPYVGSSRGGLCGLAGRPLLSRDRSRFRAIIAAEFGGLDYSNSRLHQALWRDGLLKYRKPKPPFARVASVEKAGKTFIAAI